MGTAAENGGDSTGPAATPVKSSRSGRGRLSTAWRVFGVLATVCGILGVSAATFWASDSTTSDLARIRELLEGGDVPVVEVGDGAGRVISVVTATKLEERDAFGSKLLTVRPSDVVYVLGGVIAGGSSETAHLVLGLDDDDSYEFRRGSIETVLYNTAWKWLPAGNDGLVDGGVDLGSFKPGAVTYIRFAIQVPAAERCGEKVWALRLYVTADGWAQTGAVDIPFTILKRC